MPIKTAESFKPIPVSLFPYDPIYLLDDDLTYDDFEPAIFELFQVRKELAAV